MTRAIQIKQSSKRGFGDQESWIVTRGRTSYLRIIGDYPSYSVMTATASEDDKSYYVCNNRVKVISSALQLGTTLKILPSREADRSGRKFIRICQITFTPGRKDQDLEELFAVLEKFFQIYDSCDPSSRAAMSDMREIYSALSHGSSNEDVYLCDGVWLSSDGRLHDRGR